MIDVAMMTPPVSVTIRRDCRFVLTAAGGLNRPPFARAFGDTRPCLRLQVLLRLQLVHLAEELLKQLATFRAGARLKLVHDLLRRHNTVGLILGSLPLDRLRQRHRASEVSLWVLLSQHVENLLAVRSPMLFKISQEPHRQSLDDLAAMEQQRLYMATYGHFRVWT